MASDELLNEEQEEKTMKLFDGWYKNIPVAIILDGGHVWIEFKQSGHQYLWNSEFYTEDSIDTIRLGLLNEGFRLD